MQSFSEAIRNARMKNKLGLRELAKKIDISAGYLSEIESGIKPAPSDDIIKRLADTLLIDYNKLLKLADTNKFYHTKVKIINKLFGDTKLYIEFIEELKTISEEDFNECILYMVRSIKDFKQDKIREKLWNEKLTK